MDELVAHLELALGNEMRHARRGAGAAGAAVDRAVAIKDGVAAMRALVARRAGPHHVADAGDAGILGMSKLDLLLHQAAHERAEAQDGIRRQRLEPTVILLLLDDSVKIAAIGDVDDELAKLRAIDANLRPGEIGGDVEEPHLVDEAAVALILGDDPAGRRVERDLAFLARRDEPILEPHRHRADGTMPAHRQAARYLDEEDRRVAIGA